MDNLTLKVKLLRDGARLPFRASEGAAACDLYACCEEDIVLAPGRFASVPTGIAIELPGPGYVALVFSRSGHGAKLGVSLTNSVGVIDSDYRGEILVSVINHGSEPFVVKSGERIAQLMVAPCFVCDIVQSQELSATERGSGGFGSTGVK